MARIWFSESYKNKKQTLHPEAKEFYCCCCCDVIGVGFIIVLVYCTWVFVLVLSASSG